VGPQHTYRRQEIPGTGVVETWTDVTDVSPPFVSFRTTFVFEMDRAVLTSDSTLRFRDRDEVEDSLRAADMCLEDVRGAADRPGLELVLSPDNRRSRRSQPTSLQTIKWAGGGRLVSTAPQGDLTVRAASALSSRPQPWSCQRWWWRVQAITRLERLVGPPLEKCFT
jgi:hypothetical protein